MYTIAQMRAILKTGHMRIIATGREKDYRLLIEPQTGTPGILMSRRRERRFASLETIAAFLRREGVTEWTVKLS